MGRVNQNAVVPTSGSWWTMSGTSTRMISELKSVSSVAEDREERLQQDVARLCVPAHQRELPQDEAEATATASTRVRTDVFLQLMEDNGHGGGEG